VFFTDGDSEFSQLDPEQLAGAMDPASADAKTLVLPVQCLLQQGPVVHGEAERHATSIAGPEGGTCGFARIDADREPRRHLAQVVPRLAHQLEDELLVIRADGFAQLGGSS
jgi:hypothetical protein